MEFALPRLQSLYQDGAAAFVNLERAILGCVRWRSGAKGVVDCGSSLSGNGFKLEVDTQRPVAFKSPLNV